MAKTVAPLLSWSASGQIAQTQVYSEWKGRPYVRRYVIPSNPNSAGQQLTRNVFRFLNRLFAFMPGAAIAAWELYGDNSRFTARNGFMKMNVSPLRAETDLTNIILSPSAGGGIAATDVSVVEAAGQLTVTGTPPDLPPGWAITGFTAMAVPNVDPQTSEDYTVWAGTDESDPYEVVLSNMVDAQEYVVGGWFSYTKTDGRPAYGVSVQQLATPGA